ncbi:MAG: DUF2207 domain-containing protein [Proteobacteria bacterium]|nr:DUF2207 domain-containing protein [Pseudomonadota bacterium]
MLSFTSDIVIAADGTITVTENIAVIADGDDIRHGIYRDFPTQYAGPLGLREKVGFEILAVRRDGWAEPWSTTPRDNGLRIYIGDENAMVPPGRHVYTLVYRTDRQIAFLDAVDEFAWNVTGTDWVFEIEQASGSIVLPPGARAIDVAAYTGAYGSTARDARIEARGGRVTFATTRPLGPYQGLTVAVSWPKGLVAEPGGAERLGLIVQDNPGTLIAALGLVLTVAYFLLAWRRVGRDPDKGTIIAHFGPPEGFSPVAAGYVWQGGFGAGLSRNEAFAVAITSLATKGYLRIDEAGEAFTLTRLREPGNELPVGEAVVMNHLLASGGHAVTLDGKYKPSVARAVSDLASGVKAEYRDLYRRDNRGFWIGGCLLAAASAVVGLLVDAGSLDAIAFIVFFGIFGLAFGAAFLMLLRTAFDPLLAVLRGKWSKLPAALAALVFAGMFFVPVLFVGSEIFLVASLPLCVLVLALILVTALFLRLMKAPTLAGRKVLDHIEGYRDYLSLAESDRLGMMAGEPEMTPALFERHLPYAMALGGAEAWTERFEAMAAQGAAPQDWSPSWYHSDRGSGLGQLGRSMGGISAISGLGSALGGTIASSARAPSSRSSGGGGGGGGGGGW